MNFKIKQYKIIKTKRLLKSYTIFFFKGIHWQFKSFMLMKQKLKALNFNSSKMFINIFKKLLNTSTFKQNRNLINGSLFLIYFFETKFQKKTLINFLNLWSYEILALKMYDKIYSWTQIMQMFALNYKNYKLFSIKYLISLLKNRL